MAEAFPRARVNPSAARWAREVQRRLEAAEDDLADSLQGLEQAERVLAAIKARDTDGSMASPTPWEYTLEPDTAGHDGAYIDSFSGGPSLFHSYVEDQYGQEVVGASKSHLLWGNVLVIPWMWSGEGDTYTFHIKVSFDYLGNGESFGLAVREGGDYLILGTGTVLTGPNEFEYTLSEPSNRHNSGSNVRKITVLGGAFSTGLNIEAMDLTVNGSTRQPNTWVPNGQSTTLKKVGKQYPAGSVVSWKGVLWIAATDTGTGEPDVSEEWRRFTGKPDPAYSGGWSS